MKTKSIFILAFLILGFFEMETAKAAADFPDTNETITMICNTAAGGSSDTQMRTISIYLSRHLGGAKVMVSNVPGAGGKIAYEKAYKAKPDGYTLLNYNLPSPIVTEMASEAARYKTSDFTPIYAVSIIPNILVVNAETWKTIDEFVQEGQKRTVTIGTMGTNTANYLQAVAFVEATGVKANFIPFGGGAKSVQALAGKHVDAVVTLSLTAFSLVRAGKLRTLMVFSDEADNTYPGAIVSKDSRWDIDPFPLRSTYVGPPNLPAERVKVLEEAFSKAAKEQDFMEWAKKVGVNLSPMNSERVDALTRKFYPDVMKYKKYFKK